MLTAIHNGMYYLFTYQITHRHVALGITAPLYPIVHKNLMAAIAETLGEDVVTEEVGGAWSQAVLALADLLVGAEEKLGWWSQCCCCSS